MSKFQYKYYLPENRAILISSEDSFFTSKKITDCPFPDSLLSFAYFDLRQWEEKFHEAGRALMQYYKTREPALLDPVRLVVNAFQNAHPFFAYLGLDWTERLAQAEGSKDPSKLLLHKELSHIPANLDTMQRQILFLFQTVLDAELKDIDFSARVHEYEKASRLNRFDFQPMQISYEPVGGVSFTDVLYPKNIYDVIDFSLRECVRRNITMRRCKNCGKYFALTVHGSTEYCSRVFDSRGRTCKEVGAMRQYAQVHASDELLKIYRREYKRRFAWIRAGKISQEAFAAWSKEAQKEKEKCDKGEISREDFIWKLKHP